MKTLEKYRRILLGVCAAAAFACFPVCAQAQFAVDDVITAADLQGNVEGAATALATAIAGLIVVVLAFRVLRRGWAWVRKAV